MKEKELTDKATARPWKHYHSKLRPQFSVVIDEIHGADGETVVAWPGFDGLTPKSRLKANISLIVDAVNAYDALRARNAELEEALRRIERWFGEFPDVKDRNGQPTTYGVAYGSNGERDYMRSIARAAIKG